MAHLRRFKKDAALKGRRYIWNCHLRGEVRLRKGEKADSSGRHRPRNDSLEGRFGERGGPAQILWGDGYSDGVGFDYGGAFGVGSLDADVVFAGGA